jgi:hypothetical protein
MDMIYRWINKNIELEKVARTIENFFKERGIKARIEKKKEILVHALIEKQQKRKIVTAKISGDPDDFSVEFPVENRGFKIFGNILSMIGGGVLYLKEIENEEVLAGMEEDFWRYLEETLEKLV